MRLLKRKAVVVLMALAMVVGTSAAAFAFFTGAGAGTGSATVAGTAGSTITVTQEAQAIKLYPGGPTVTLKGTLTNNADSSVWVTKVMATSADAGPTCGPENFTLVQPTAEVNSTIEPGATASWEGIRLQMKETNVNQDTCKGTTVTITYTTLAS